jgi:shikimate kinase
MRIFLTGFMATGKTYIGKQLAEKLELNFLDLDQEIELLYNTSIPQIFSEKGEAEFRIIEEQVLERKVKGNQSFVIACGGGTVFSNKNLQLIKTTGISVFINTSIEEIIKRLEKDKANRPLISGIEGEEFQNKIKELHSLRQSVYELADIHYYPEKENLSDLIKKIIKLTT